MLNVADGNDATSTALRSGIWSDPLTWDTPPATGARVLIPHGLSVTVDSEISPAFEWIRVNGALRFACDANTALEVATIVVDPAGIFEVGASEAPGQFVQADKRAKITFADFGEIDRIRDPQGFGRGLASHGIVRIHGAFTTPYAFVAQPAIKGATTLQVFGVPANWKVGGRLILPSVVYLYADAGDGLMLDDDEELTITSIAPSTDQTTTTVVLNRALKYDHVPPAGVPVPLAYLDRNVVFASKNTAVSRRGHVLLMHKNDVQIADALFEQLGRTDVSREVTDPQVDANGRLIPATTGNDRGRYALHVHRSIADPEKPAFIRRVCVVNSPKFGIVNHDSNVICEDSVVYDAAGSAFFTEIGSEIGAFRRNLAIRTVRGGGSRGDVERFAADGIGTGELPNGPDFGSNGNGFWFQGAGVEVVDNMSFKCKDMAFVYDTLGLVIDGVETRFLRSNLTPDNLFYDPNKTGATVRVSEVPINRFSGNIAAAAYTGFMLRKNDPIGKPSIMENSIAVNISDFGIDAEYGGPKVFRNVYVQGGTATPAGIPKWLNGLGGWGFICNENSNNITIENCEIRNFIRGLRFTVSQTNRISNTLLDNIWNLTIENGPNTQDTTVIEGVTFAHTVPLLASQPFNRYEDIQMYRPHGPTAPVEYLGEVRNDPPDLLAPAAQPIPLYWGVQRSWVFYSVSTAPRAALLQSSVCRLTGQPASPEIHLPLTTASPGQGGIGIASDYTVVLTFDKFLSAATVSIATGTASILGGPVIDQNQVTVELSGVNSTELLSLAVETTSEDGLTSAMDIAVTSAVVSVLATSEAANEAGRVPGVFTITRIGAADAALTVHYSVSGTAANSADYATLSGLATIPAGATTVEVVVAPLADSFAEGSEDVKLALTPDAGYTLSSTVSATVTIADHPMDSWRGTVFGEDADTSLIAGDNADPDYDQRTNFLEFALASDPKSPTPDSLPLVSLEGGALSITYRRPVEVGDITYLVQMAENSLQTWVDANATEQTLFEDAVTRVVKASVPVQGAPSKVIRLLIKRP